MLVWGIWLCSVGGVGGVVIFELELPLKVCECEGSLRGPECVGGGIPCEMVLQGYVVGRWVTMVPNPIG